MTEYAILFGLLALLSLGGLSLLGKSVKGLLSSATQPSGAGSLQGYMDSMLGPTANASVLATPTGQTAGNPNAATPDPNDLLQGVSPVSVNVSSVDGSNSTVQSNMKLAQRLDQLAQQATDPTSQEYFGQLAKTAYYMGANEGQIDGLDGYSRGKSYTNGDALNNLIDLSADFKKLMANPPAGVSQADLAAVTPLTRQVDGIGDKYLKSLHSLVDGSSSGKTSIDFSLMKTNVTLSKGNSTESNTHDTAADSQTPVATFVAKLKNTTYEALVPYDQLKAQVDDTLNSHPSAGSDEPVLNTFHDARETDQHAWRHH